MTKQDKIKKVMDEFKRGTLKTPDGKVVKNRKQALAIAMSESEDYTEKGELIHQLSIGSVDEAIDILKSAGTVDEDLFEKAHQDGDMHPNGKWVWVSSANGGKGDWRTAGGRTHKKHQAGATAGSSSTGTSGTGNTVQPKPKAATQPKLTTSQQRIVDGFMDRVKTSDSRYSDPSKVTLWKTPKGNWYVKYDGHQVATIAPSGLTEKIAEAAGMKIDREPSSYQSSKTKKSTTPKTDKERLDLQQEYATMSQLIKKPSTSAQHKKEFQERMKEIEGMGLKVVKGKFQWSDTGTAATPKSTSSKQDIFDSNGTTVLGSANRILFVKQLSEDLRKKLSSLPVIRIDDDGLQPGDIRNGAAKTPEQQNNLRELIDEGVLVTVKKNGRISGYTLNKNYDFSKKSTKQKKLRPVGTGTNGPERRTKESQERIDKKKSTQTKKKNAIKAPKGWKQQDDDSISLDTKDKHTHVELHENGYSVVVANMGRDGWTSEGSKVFKTLDEAIKAGQKFIDGKISSTELYNDWNFD